METKERVRCCQVIRDGLGICSRWASVTRDGKGYCKQHDPLQIQVRNDANVKKWEDRIEAAPWPSGVTYSQQLDATLQNALELRQSQRTLSRDTAIKLVEAAEDAIRYRDLTALQNAVEAAKHELGI